MKISISKYFCVKSPSCFTKNQDNEVYVEIKYTFHFKNTLNNFS